MAMTAMMMVMLGVCVAASCRNCSPTRTGVWLLFWAEEKKERGGPGRDYEQQESGSGRHRRREKNENRPGDFL